MTSTDDAATANQGNATGNETMQDSFEETRVLRPGQSVMAYASYAVTSDDIAASHVTNVALITYVDADGNSNKSAESTVTTSGLTAK